MTHTTKTTILLTLIAAASPALAIDETATGLNGAFYPIYASLKEAIEGNLAAFLLVGGAIGTLLGVLMGNFKWILYGMGGAFAAQQGLPILLGVSGVALDIQDIAPVLPSSLTR